MDAVEDRHRPIEGLGPGLGDVRAPAVDERVDGAAPGAGQEPDVLSGVGELLGDGGADGAGAGDDVDGVHAISSWGD